MTEIGPAQVQQHLQEAEYPATRAELVTLARRKGADPQVLAVLEQLPDRRYSTSAQVSEAIAAAQFGLDLPPPERKAEPGIVLAPDEDGM